MTAALPARLRRRGRKWKQELGKALAASELWARHNARNRTWRIADRSHRPPSSRRAVRVDSRPLSRIVLASA